MLCRVVIAGGGISGLSTAYQLLKDPRIHVTLVEKTDHVGGYLNTKRESDSIVETGPRSIRVSGGGLTLKIIKEIGLTPLLGNEATKNRYIYYSKGEESPKINVLPSSISHWLKDPSSLPMWKDIIGSQLMHSIKGDSSIPNEYTSIHDFFCKQFGEKFASKLGAAMVIGIYSGDSKILSLKDCFPDIYNYFQKHGQSTFLRSMIKSFLNSKEKKFVEPIPEFDDISSQKLKSVGMYSFNNGLQQLPETMLEYMKNNYSDRFEYYNGFSVSKVSDGNNFPLKIQSYTQDGECITLDADHLFSALPSFVLSELLKPRNGEISELLESIPYGDITVVALEWNEPISIGYEGFGYLVSPETKENILGVTFDSQNFPIHNPGRTVLSVMMKSKSIKDYNSVAKDVMKKHLKIQQEPDIANAFVYEQGIPQYRVGHYKIADKIENLLSEKDNLKNISIVGNSLRGVSINTCIKSGITKANEYITTLPKE